MWTAWELNPNKLFAKQPTCLRYRAHVAESRGIEPLDRINDHSLANYCNNRSANSPFCGRPETRTLTPLRLLVFKTSPSSSRMPSFLARRVGIEPTHQSFGGSADTLSERRVLNPINLRTKKPESLLTDSGWIYCEI